MIRGASSVVGRLTLSEGRASLSGQSALEYHPDQPDTARVLPRTAQPTRVPSSPSVTEERRRCPFRPRSSSSTAGSSASRTDVYNLLRPLLKQTVSYRYNRGRELVANGTGWVERIVVDHPEISTYFTPLSICLNVDSFEHLEFETRADQLIVYRSSRVTRASTLEFAPLGASPEPPAAPPARVRHERLRADGAAGPRIARGRVGGAWVCAPEDSHPSDACRCITGRVAGRGGYAATDITGGTPSTGPDVASRRQDASRPRDACTCITLPDVMQPWASRAAVPPEAARPPRGGAVHGAGCSCLTPVAPASQCPRSPRT